MQGGGKGAVKAGKAAPKVSEADRAVLQLKMQRDKMLQGRKKVLSVMARETEIAKALLKVCPPPSRKQVCPMRKCLDRFKAGGCVQMGTSPAPSGSRGRARLYSALHHHP